MRWIFLSLLLLAGEEEGVFLAQGKVLGIPCLVAHFSLESVELVPVPAQEFLLEGEPLSHLVRRIQPLLAVGISGDPQRPSWVVGPLFLGGKPWGGGWRGAYWVRLRNGSWCMGRWQEAPRGFPQQIETGFTAGPLLMSGGRLTLEPLKEGWEGADFSLEAQKERIALGLGSSGKGYVVMTQQPVSLLQLALMLRRMGCTDALQVAWGEQVGLYGQGRLWGEEGAFPAALCAFPKGRVRREWLASLLPPQVSPLPLPTGGPQPVVVPPSAPSALAEPRKWWELKGLPSDGVVRGPLTLTVEFSLPTFSGAVAFYVDGRLRLLVNRPPYLLRIEPADYPPGSHLLEVKIWDEEWRLKERANFPLRWEIAAVEGEG